MIKSLDEVVKEAAEKRDRLIAEREHRQSGQHADDKRIASEIADHLWELGKKYRALVEQNDRLALAIATNIKSIETVEQLSRNLNIELVYATGRELAPVKPPQTEP